MTNATLRRRLFLEALDSRINPDGAPSGAGILDAGHIDVFEIEFEPAQGPDQPAELGLQIHDEERDEEFSVDGTTFVLKPESQVDRPTGAAFNFLGIPEGKSIWLIPQLQNPNLLFGGVSAEEIEIGALGKYLETDPRVNQSDEFVRVEMVGFSGPGEMSIWTNDPFGTPIVFWQTADGVNAPGTPTDTLFSTPQAHADVNFAFTAAGEYTVQVRATAFLSDNKLNPIASEVQTYRFFVQSGPTSVPPKVRAGLIAAAPDAGASPIVRILNPITGGTVFTVQAYEDAFRGGVNVALGDVNGDGIEDIVTGAGAGGGPRIEIFDGVTGKSTGSFFAYEPEFTGGVTVALGDLDGDGIKDIITGTGVGGGPRVVAFSGKDRSQIANFFAYEPTFRGGINVSSGDVDGDGTDDIGVGAGVGGGPRVVVVSGKDLSVLRNYFAYESEFRGGVNVSLADFNDDGNADVIAGSGVGGGPRIRVLDGKTDSATASLADFFAFDRDDRFGIRVSAVDSNGDDELELLVGNGGDGRIERYNLAGERLNGFTAFEDEVGVRLG